MPAATSGARELRARGRSAKDAREPMSAAERHDDAPATATTAAPKDTSAQAGRGGLAIAAAKLYFIVLGFAQQSVVNHLLGGGYGTYRRAQSFARS